MSFLLHRLKHSPKSKGDTIIEVLISISILSLVLAVSYVSTSNSLHQGTNAANRLQGLSFAQQQIEIIKNAQTAYPTAFTSYYETSTPFCVLPGSADTAPKYGVTAASTGNCTFGGAYTISEVYSGGLFTVSSNWPNAGSNSQNSLQVFYRIPVTPSGGGGGGGGSSVSLSASATTITVGQSTTLSWSGSADITACSSASPSGWPGSTAASGSKSLTPATSTSYTITCTGTSGSVTSNAVSVTVNPLGGPTAAKILTFAPDSAAIADGAATVLRWTSSNATSCDMSGGLTLTGLAVNSSVGTGNLAGGSGGTTYTYGLICHGAGGDSSPASTSVAVAAAAGGGSGGGGGNPNPPACFLNVSNDGGNTAGVVGGDCQPQDANGDKFTASGSATATCNIDPAICNVLGHTKVFGCSGTTQCVFPTPPADYSYTAGSRSVTFTISACNANGCSGPSDPLSAGTTW